MDNLAATIMGCISLILLAIALIFIVAPGLEIIHTVINSGILSTEFWEIGLALIALVISTIMVAIKAIDSIRA